VPETTSQPAASTNQSSGEQATVERDSRSQPSQSPSAKEKYVNEPTRQKSPSLPKRKAREDVEDQPPTKRVAVVDDEVLSEDQEQTRTADPEPSTDRVTPAIPRSPAPTPAVSNVSDPIVGESTTTEEQLPIPEIISSRVEPSKGASPSTSTITPAEENTITRATDVGVIQDRDSADSSTEKIQNPTPPQSQNVSTSPTPVEASSAAVPGPGVSEHTERVTEAPRTALPGTADLVDESATSGNDTPITKKRKRVTKRKVQKKKAGGDATAATDVEEDRPEGAPRKRKTKRKRDPTKKRSKRADTPEDAEDEVIDVTTMKMADLCKDLKIGKKFSKADIIRERLIKQKAADKVRLDKAARAENRDEGTAGDDTEQAGQSRDGSPPETGNLGLQMRVVDGHIVLNDETTQVNRQDRFDPSRIQEVIEEDDFTRVITQNTFGKQWGKPRTQAWDEAATEMFYKGLRTWGTDFETIAKMFPHRTRKQIKMKFNREERDNSARVTRTLNEPRGVVNHEESLAEFQELSGKTLEEVGDIQAEYDKVQAEHDAEQARLAQEKIEADAKKRAEIEAKSKLAGNLLDEDGEEVTGSAKENAGTRKGRKKNEKRKKKNMHSSSGGGETMEVLASIEID
jgi:transcription factor TFIIIB component B''